MIKKQKLRKNIKKKFKEHKQCYQINLKILIFKEIRFYKNFILLTIKLIDTKIVRRKQ